jgi:hypothetical protein
MKKILRNGLWIGIIMLCSSWVAFVFLIWVLAK